MPTLLCDLDGTLANLSHRRHFVDGKKSRWDLFFEACDKDVPIQKTISLIHTIQLGASFMEAAAKDWKLTTIIVSGRSEVVRAKTENWLLDHGISYDKLIMRAAKDYRADDIVKEEWLLNGDLGKREDIIWVFDDRDRVVNMWRRNGLQCYQVAPGDF